MLLIARLRIGVAGDDWKLWVKRAVEAPIHGKFASAAWHLYIRHSALCSLPSKNNPQSFALSSMLLSDAKLS